MNRKKQIKYIVARFRLLNCIQRMQPGGVSYYGRQYTQAYSKFYQSRKQVINPVCVLLKMKPKISDLLVIIPYLADNNYIPTVSYWRDFHPNRTLHKVNWIVAEIVNRVAKRDLIELSQFNVLTPQQKQQHIAKIIEWCEKNKTISWRFETTTILSFVIVVLTIFFLLKCKPQILT